MIDDTDAFDPEADADNEGVRSNEPVDEGKTTELEEGDADGVVEDGELTIAALTGVDVESTVGSSTEAAGGVIEVAPALTGAELDTIEVSGFIASSPIDSPFFV
jgi:hypothetical protein